MNYRWNEVRAFKHFDLYEELRYDSGFLCHVHRNTHISGWAISPKTNNRWNGINAGRAQTFLCLYPVLPLLKSNHGEATAM